MIIATTQQSDDATLEIIFNELSETVEYSDIEWPEIDYSTNNVTDALDTLTATPPPIKDDAYSHLGGTTINLSGATVGSLDPFNFVENEAIDHYAHPHDFISALSGDYAVKQYSSEEGQPPVYYDPLGQISDAGESISGTIENANAVDNFNRTNPGFVVMGHPGGGQRQFTKEELAEYELDTQESPTEIVDDNDGAIAYE